MSVADVQQDDADQQGPHKVFHKREKKEPSGIDNIAIASGIGPFQPSSNKLPESCPSFIGQEYQGVHPSVEDRFLRRGLKHNNHKQCNDWLRYSPVRRYDDVFDI